LNEKGPVSDKVDFLYFSGSYIHQIPCGNHMDMGIEIEAIAAFVDGGQHPGFPLGAQISATADEP